MQGSSSQSNAENKLFVGGCPSLCGEEDLRRIFERHGQVEEVFIMRGGSRSGMACAFVRFRTREMAQQAIDAIHGQTTLPTASEPLVVRWADAPGSRRRESRERSGRRGGSRGEGKGGHAGASMSWAAQQGYGFEPIPMHQMQMPMQVAPGFGTQYYPQGQMGNYGAQYVPQPQMHWQYVHQHSPQAMGGYPAQQAGMGGYPSPSHVVMPQGPMVALPQGQPPTPPGPTPPQGMGSMMPQVEMPSPQAHFASPQLVVDTPLLPPSQGSQLPPPAQQPPPGPGPQAPQGPSAPQGPQDA